MSRWHPWRHAREHHPRTPIAFVDGGRGCAGRITLNGIEINRTSTQRERRCTLTHELVHLERGPVPRDARAVEREEKAVHAIAACRLIEIDHLIDVLVWNRHRVDDETADELWVDLPTLVTRVQNLTVAERRYIDAELERREP
ncbi:ImmA/IrrE family metallo-endopeptidase [Rhodococcus sp. MEB041]|uniref:ImmA/IrrE family metallo-endopeptidase n=1 Tax=Rhodococcus sp. MEB041 TaxID=3040323 RepID=UPI00254D095F|nr:ImmA/IrrE family metallo-endopeptidase [Rhodococcus sp. MEB041]